MKPNEQETELSPNNWAYLPLRSLVLFAIGGDWGKLPSKNATDYSEVKVIRGTDYKIWENERAKNASIRMIQRSSFLKRKLNFGDIVVEISGGSQDQPVGRTIVIDDLALNDPYPLVCSNFFRKIHFSEYVSPFFLNYFFQYSYKRGDYNKIQTETTNLRNLSFESFLNQNVPFPILAEQVEIVDKLDELLGKINLAQNVVDKIPLLIKSIKKKILTSAFTGELTKDFRLLNSKNGIQKLSIEKKPLEDQSKIEISDKSLLPEIPGNWEYVLIGEIEKFIGSGSTPKGKNKYLKSGVPFLRSQNVYPEGLITDEIVYISEEQHNKMARTKLYPNDILLNITGASIGRSTYLPKDFKEGNVNQHVCIIRLPENILPEFASLFLNSDLGQKLIFSSQTGVTREGLNFSQVRGLWIPLIPFEEQVKLIATVNDLFSRIDSFQTKYVATRNKLESLPFRLLQDAFHGELVDSDLESEDIDQLLEKIKVEKKTFNEALNDDSKKITFQSMNANKQLSLESIIRTSFNNEPFYYQDIVEYFETDYETTKEQFFELVKSKKILLDYDKEAKAFKFSLN